MLIALSSILDKKVHGVYCKCITLFMMTVFKILFNILLDSCITLCIQIHYFRITFYISLYYFSFIHYSFLFVMSIITLSFWYGKYLCNLYFLYSSCIPFLRLRCIRTCIGVLLHMPAYLHIYFTLQYPCVFDG